MHEPCLLYFLKGAEGKFMSLKPTSGADWDVFKTFDGKHRLASAWQDIRVEQVRSHITERGGTLGDFPSIGYAGVPVISERARSALEDLIAPCTEFLPLDADGTIYWALNVICTKDLLDKNRSTIKYASDSRILYVKKFVFRSCDAGDSNIFKIPEDPLSAVFVTERFKERVEGVRLSEMAFETVKVAVSH